MFIFFVFVAVIVVIAWIRVRAVPEEALRQNRAMDMEESEPKKSVRKARSRSKMGDFWSFPNESGGSDGGGFDGGGSHGGDGSSTGF